MKYKYKYKFKPNSQQKEELKKAIVALETWIENAGRDLHACRARTGTVYFWINDRKYRVAGHRPGVYYEGEITFHAAPTRAPEIAAALLAGKQLDGRGNVK